MILICYFKYKERGLIIKREVLFFDLINVLSICWVLSIVIGNWEWVVKKDLEGYLSGVYGLVGGRRINKRNELINDISVLKDKW